jgi:hypothetical protein
MLAAGVATIAASIGVTSSYRIGDEIVANAIALDAALLSAFVVLAAMSLLSWRGGQDALGRAAASVFPMLYVGLPIGALVALRTLRGRAALFLLLLTVMVSDTAQHCSWQWWADGGCRKHRSCCERCSAQRSSQSESRAICSSRCSSGARA